MLDVPFHAQRELHRDEGGTPWADRACAIACLTMLLAFHGRALTMAEVLAQALARGAFHPQRGWLHTGLVDLLQASGLTAYRRNWRLLDGAEQRYLAGRPSTPATRREIALVKAQMIEEGLRTVAALTDAGLPVITSVHRPWGARDTIGHQIVVIGTDGDAFVHHDPAEPDGAHRRVPVATFTASWKGLAIVALSP